MNIFNAISSNLLGHLVVTSDGAVLASSGDLENDEKTSDILYKLINIASSLDPSVFQKNSLQRLTIAYDDFCYVVCFSNRKFYIAKKKILK
ncbi:hypothetical protein PVAND_003614 [Polypedilum vanderplanki]|uniref:Late endosomal/lysosomal adaptor and MAPK and MTOR activator 4 n=1 Tax=Polypedilum vanderplanki TaxID=319348 RepID=A0A9J6BV36_POLVA|nr:hypothetical protein PVAND_003614 [Polypedilum vanderplanki]